MCGLVGIAGDLRYADEFTMKRLLLADYFRGQDSTGLASIATNGDISVAKIASNPIDLFNLKTFDKALNGNGSRAFIGHNRARTRGTVSTANAHPFQVEHIVGAHNGTLDYASVKALETALGEEFAVDSLALITGIAKLGVKKTIEMCVEGKTYTDGAWALTWFDQSDGTLNFLRNKHRPLFHSFIRVGEEDKFSRIVWASEWWMIREALESSLNGKYKLFTRKEGENNIGYFMFDTDIHYKFDLAELKEGTAKTPPKPKAKKLRGKEPVAVKTYVPFDSWPREKDKTCGTLGGNVTNLKSPKNINSPSKKAEKKVIQLIGEPNKHPYANIIDEDKFLSFADGHGETRCTYCDEEITFGDPGISVFEREAKLLCRKCTGIPDDQVNPPVRIYVRSSVFDVLCN